MKRAAQAVAMLALLGGVFWAGRESSHGLSAFGDHWWCPIPVVMIVLAAAALVATVAGARHRTA